MFALYIADKTIWTNLFSPSRTGVHAAQAMMDVRCIMRDYTKYLLLMHLFVCEQVPDIKMSKKQELNTSGLLVHFDAVQHSLSLVYPCFPPCICLYSEMLLVELEFCGAFPIEFMAQFV
jgi:hypothetical protein